MSTHPVAATEALAPRIGTNLGAIDGDAIERDQTALGQHPEHLDEQLAQCFAVRNAEVGQRVMVDRPQRGEPLQSGLVLHLPGDLTR